MEEIWKDIQGYEGKYQVSNLGRVKSLIKDNNIILKQKKNSRGYMQVGLYSNKLKKTYRVHSLVAIAFLNHVPCAVKRVINHKDLNKDNNKLSNLEIISARENSAHYYKTTKNNYTGVFKHRNRFASRIYFNKKSHNLGTFDTAIEAREHYKKCAKLIEDGKDIEFIETIRGFSKYKGVDYQKNNKNWRARIRYNKKQHTIGVFKTEYEAHLAYEEFKKNIIKNKL